jgi:probable rRNA maturation factor
MRVQPHPKGSFTLDDRQRVRPVRLRLLRRLVKALLEDLLQAKDFDLGISLVATGEMTSLNETFLQHEGSTDVITFDYSETKGRGGRSSVRKSRFTQPLDPPIARPGPLCGEICVCVPEAIAQARRFRTTWQSELARYIIHGVLHLQGFDDSTPSVHRAMKREEDRLLRELGGRFDIGALGSE